MISDWGWLLAGVWFACCLAVVRLIMHQRPIGEQVAAICLVAFGPATLISDAILSWFEVRNAKTRSR
jgi:hypothetical protein